MIHGSCPPDFVEKPPLPGQCCGECVPANQPTTTVSPATTATVDLIGECKRRSTPCYPTEFDFSSGTCMTIAVDCYTMIFGSCPPDFVEKPPLPGQCCGECVRITTTFEPPTTAGTPPTMPPFFTTPTTTSGIPPSDPNSERECL